MKVTYQNETFKETLKPDLHLEHIEALREQSYQAIVQQQSWVLSSDFKHYANRVSKIIKDFVYSLPNATDSLEIHNIYLSCLLSFLNSITLSNSMKKKIELKEIRTSNVDMLLEKLYAEANEKAVILFHLPDSMHNYIMTLLARIRRLIQKDLSDLVGMNLAGDSSLFDAILLAQA